MSLGFSDTAPSMRGSIYIMGFVTVMFVTLRTWLQPVDLAEIYLSTTRSRSQRTTIRHCTKEHIVCIQCSSNHISGILEHFMNIYAWIWPIAKHRSRSKINVDLTLNEILSNQWDFVKNTTFLFQRKRIWIYGLYNIRYNVSATIC